MSPEQLSSFEILPQDRQALCALLNGDRAPERYPSVRHHLRRCEHPPSEQVLILIACNEVLEGHGIEYLEGEWVDEHFGRVQASYVNMGDSYLPTVLLDHVEDTWQIACIADFLEDHPGRFPG